LDINTELIKCLREATGAGIMDCRSALIETKGNVDEATKILKQKGLATAAKRADRTTSQGLVEAYVHPGGKLGVMVEVNCETDFVARTDVFKELVHNLALQIAGAGPICVTKEEIPSNIDLTPEEACLLLQPYIKDPAKCIQDLLNDAVAKTGENIKIKRFCRFTLGS
jgi:elongation factor Ts